MEVVAKKRQNKKIYGEQVDSKRDHLTKGSMRGSRKTGNPVGTLAYRLNQSRIHPKILKTAVPHVTRLSGHAIAEPQCEWSIRS
jgi:hypothetical protein